MMINIMRYRNLWGQRGYTRGMRNGLRKFSRNLKNNKYHYCAHMLTEILELTRTE